MTGAPHGFPNGGDEPGIHNFQFGVGRAVGSASVTIKKDWSNTRDEVKTDNAGNFTLGALPTGNYDIELGGTSLEHAISSSIAKQPSGDTGPKGPANIIAILIALLLPEVQPLPGAGHPGANTSSGSILVQHEFSHATPNQGVHIKFRVGKNGAAMTIDWGDGTPVMDVGREGKRVGSPSENASLVGSWGVDHSESHKYIGHVTLVK
jgi:hypothetical protein